MSVLTNCFWDVSGAAQQSSPFEQGNLAAAGSRGATMVLWFEAVWMVFALEHVLQDQSRSMWTQAVM